MSISRRRLDPETTYGHDVAVVLEAQAPRTGASHIAEAVSELLQEGHTRTLRVIFHTVAAQTPISCSGEGGHGPRCGGGAALDPGFGFFNFVSTGPVVPTTCSLTTCLTTCKCYPNGRIRAGECYPNGRIRLG